MEFQTENWVSLQGERKRRNNEKGKKQRKEERKKDRYRKTESDKERDSMSKYKKHVFRGKLGSFKDLKVVIFMCNSILGHNTIFNIRS